MYIVFRCTYNVIGASFITPLYSVLMRETVFIGHVAECFNITIIAQRSLVVYAMYLLIPDTGNVMSTCITNI